MAVNAVSDVPSDASLTPAKETVPRVANAIMMAKESPMSPIRFITNAFLEAVAYAGF